MMSHRATTSLLAGLVLVCSSVAHADIAIETYVDARVPDAERAPLERLKAALQANGVVTSAAQIESRYEQYLPLPGFTPGSVTRSDLRIRIDQGEKLVAHEAYSEATVILEGVFRDLARNPALAVSDPGSRSWLTRGRVALIVSYLHTKSQSGASELMLDHIRNYPDASLHGAQAEVEKLYDTEFAAITKLPRGRLVFKAGQPDAEVFVNAEVHAHGQLDVNLYPGDYLVVVRYGNNVYRSYLTSVHSNETTERASEWPADVAFHADASWVGFAGTRELQDSATDFVKRLAARLPKEAVIAIGIIDHDGHRFLVATRYDEGSDPRPGRALALEQASDVNIGTLAAYVSAARGERPQMSSPGLVPIPDTVKPRSQEVRADVVAGPSRTPAIVAAALFSAALPTGGYLIKRGHDCQTGSCDKFTAPGAALLGVSGLALGFWIGWALHVQHHSTTATAFDFESVRGGGVASVVGRF